MEIKFHIKDKFKTPLIVLCNHELNDEMYDLQRKIASVIGTNLVGFTEDGSVIVDVADIIRIYTQDQKIYAQTLKEVVVLKERLYQLEEDLTERGFIRISNAELVNMRKIIKLDTSLTGTIKMELTGGIETYVSRRNVTKLKKAIGIRKDGKHEENNV